jgi:uncharacterized protein YegP (UPF0339 family)
MQRQIVAGSRDSVAAKFVIKDGSSKSFRFNLKAGNGQVILTSENYKSTNGQVIRTSQMYNSKAAMEKGIAPVQRNAPSCQVVDVCA